MKNKKYGEKKMKIGAMRHLNRMKIKTDDMFLQETR
jgi:hypothetical protein